MKRERGQEAKRRREEETKRGDDERRVFSKRITFRVQDELNTGIILAAKQEEKSVAEYIRKVLEDDIVTGSLKRDKEELQNCVSKTVHTQLEPVEDRLVKICAKTAHAAAISMFMNLQVIFDLEKNDVMEIWKVARGKGLAFVGNQESIAGFEGEIEKLLDEDG